MSPETRRTWENEHGEGFWRHGRVAGVVARRSGVEGAAGGHGNDDGVKP